MKTECERSEKRESKMIPAACLWPKAGMLASGFWPLLLCYCLVISLTFAKIWMRISGSHFCFLTPGSIPPDSFGCGSAVLSASAINPHFPN